MNKSLGNKRHFISEDQINEFTKLYGNFAQNKNCKIFDGKDFAYNRITVEQPLINDEGQFVRDNKGNLKADSKKRDYENIPLMEDIQTYFEKEVLPHVPDAWIDEKKTKVGYEINFTKYFYEYKPLRSTEKIRIEIESLRNRIKGLSEKAIEI